MTGMVELRDARVTDVDGDAIRILVGYGYDGGYGQAGVWVPRSLSNWRRKYYPSDSIPVKLDRRVMERVALRISQFRRSGRPVWIYLEGGEPAYRTKQVAVLEGRTASPQESGPVPFTPVHLPMAASAITY